jgi:hypothetical protein
MSRQMRLQDEEWLVPNYLVEKKAKSGEKDETIGL